MTPLDAERFEEELRDHPDRTFVSYVVEGIRSGFDIGFIGPQEETLAGNPSFFWLFQLLAWLSKGVS